MVIIMNDEIKEILDNKLYFDLDEEDYIKIKDCITNLQQNYERIYNENCKLREQHNITDISILDENYRLQQLEQEHKKINGELREENRRLKELCDEYEEEHSNEFQCWKRDRKELLDKRGRIQKASEYFKYQLENLDFYEDTKARMLCAMGITLLQNGSDSQ